MAGTNAHESAGRHATATPGFWWWLLQRFSGAALVVLILAHGWYSHFVPIGDVRAGLQAEPVVFEAVKRRLAQSGFIALDFLLLGLVLYHGLNGMRNIFLEWGPAAKRQRLVEGALWTVGLAAFAVGARTLAIFIWD